MFSLEIEIISRYDFVPRFLAIICAFHSFYMLREIYMCFYIAYMNSIPEQQKLVFYNFLNRELSKRFSFTTNLCCSIRTTAREGKRCKFVLKCHVIRD